MIFEINDDNFRQEVLDESKPVLVDFWAGWCRACQLLSPVIDELAGEMKDVLKICKADVDRTRAAAVTYRVLNIPTVLLFKNGEEKERFVGVSSKDEIKGKIIDHI